MFLVQEVGSRATLINNLLVWLVAFGGCLRHACWACGFLEAVLSSTREGATLLVSVALSRSSAVDVLFFLEVSAACRLQNLTASRREGATLPVSVALSRPSVVDALFCQSLGSLTH